ncbi:MAG: DUF4168 domain-containing protein [Chitinispirillales bacterium]|jgi:Glu-tRNA(Gln) amidotransferase subunit E-like FAD-binding protein|nr:DUF4168 domain-containing protein [Chitinispirillales bacterium]
MSAFRKKIHLSAFITGGLIVLMLVLSVTGSIPGLGGQSAVNLSDEEIASFVQVNHRMINIQSELEERMIKIIEEQGLTVDRYVEILMTRENPELASSVTDKEMEKINKANEKIEGLNQELHEKSLAVIAEEGLSIERYEEIANAMQNSTSSQKRYNEMMEELRGQSAQG